MKKSPRNAIKRLAIGTLAGALTFSTMVGTEMMSDPVSVKAATTTARQAESLGRGLIAMKTSNGVFISWRYLGTDSSSVGFNIYKDGKKINSSVINNSTNFTDRSGSTSSKYYVATVVNGKEVEKSETVSVYQNQYFDIPLNKPAGGSVKGSSYTYTPNDASVADLDGDGEYEIILKWDPSNSKDNSQKGYTGSVIIDAYKMNGTRLWRVDLGKNIRAGAHYTQFMVYDFDGDGSAEMVCKTADGTKDGKGTYIGDNSKDYRNSSGYVLSGPEYLTLFDGKTGAALDTINYEPARGTVKSWGDSYGNRVDRFLGAVAYLNGKTPSVVMCRGYYTRAVLVAYNVSNKKLVKQWKFDSNDSGNSAYAGQGFHNLATADVDNDGCDEIVYGACTIDHNGKGLYSTGLKHGDAIHVGDFDPTRPGLEAWGCFEEKYGAALWDAKTGKVLVRKNASTDTGRCIAGNFVPGNKTAEMASYSDSVLYDASGNKVGNWSDVTKWGMNYAIYWDGDLEQEALDRTFIDGYKKGRLFTAEGCVSNNTTKANSSITADIIGDWREEVVLPTEDGNKLRVFSTTIETNYRLYTLMHNMQYRCQVAAQNVGYNQGAYTDYFIGTGYNLPAQPNIYTVGKKGTATNSGASNSGSSNSGALTQIGNVKDGWYYIKNINSQKYLQVKDNLGKNGQNVEISKGTGVTGQKWYVKNLGNGYVSIQNALGYMLDVTAGSSDNSVNIEIYSANGRDSQTFALAKTNSSNVFGILTKSSELRKGLDVQGNKTADGTNVQQYSYGEQGNQTWVFEPITYTASTNTGNENVGSATGNVNPGSTTGNANPGSATGNSNAGSTNSCAVSVKVESDWTSGATASITVKNTSGKDIKNWKVTINMDRVVTNIWNANLVSSEKGKTIISCPGWQTTLKAGESYTINGMLGNSASTVIKSAILQ